LSCGCYSAASLAARNFKHGLTKNHRKEFDAYAGAKARCSNSRHKSFPYYGGRGIQFEFSSFEEFLNHIGSCPLGCELDRIDNNGHYEKNNVHWVTHSENCRNRRQRQRKTLDLAAVAA
jgi:hypothetical protein